jgi:hypothetical protein
MNHHLPSKLSVAAVMALAILLTPPRAFAAGGNGRENLVAPEAPGGCPRCKQAPVCDPAIAGCREPRIIRYSYPSGALTVEGDGGRPDARLRPDEPVAVRVCCVNPYRHTVNVKIDQTTFDELYKTPSQVTNNLLPQDAKDKTKQTSAANAAKTTVDSAKAKVDAAAKPKPGKAADAKMKQAVASAQAEMVEAEALAALVIKLTDFNEDADQLVRVDELVASQRVRVLQIDDPTVLRTASVNAAIATAKAAVDPDHPTPARCSDKECSPEALILVRAELAEHIEADFTELATAYQKAKKNKLVPVTVDVAELYAKAEKRHEALGSSRAQRDLQFASAMSVYANVLDPDFGCVLFGPVAATGDEVEITVETPLAAEAANFTLAPEAEKTASSGGAGSKKPTPAKVAASQPALIIPVIGSHRPSFSTGIFFTSLVNPTFFKDKANLARENSTDRFTPALGAMVHTPLFFPCPEASIQLSLGVALKDSNPLYLLGPSVVIGRRQRTVITAAIAGGQVNRLSGLNLGDTVTDAQPKTEKVFRYGFLLGLTYNFGPATQTSTSSSKSSSK